MKKTIMISCEELKRIVASAVVATEDLDEGEYVMQMHALRVGDGIVGFELTIEPYKELN